MKPSLFAGIFFFLAITPITMRGQQTKPTAPAGARIGTATRLVVLFHDLEQQLVAAEQKHDEAALERLLSADFEARTPEPPGEPMPRATWLQRVSSAGGPESFSIRQMAVRGLDNHAIASFVLLQGGGQKRAQFVVDVWARDDIEWKLTERYVSQVPAGLYAGKQKPSGKN